MFKIQSLNGTWDIIDLSNQTCYKGSVPGSVIQTLLEQGEIEDPYWRCNEYEVRERMARDYSYEYTFPVCEEDLAFPVAELVCEGLDTITSIYLNGSLIAETNDMHRTYRFLIQNYLKVGTNHIRIVFHSALMFVRAEDEKNDIFYASTGSIHGNAALRKAHYMFGWDWGPQLPDMGIFRKIQIEYSNTARLEDVHIRQFHESDGQVRLTVDTMIRGLEFSSSESNSDFDEHCNRMDIICKMDAICLEVCVELTDPDGQVVFSSSMPAEVYEPIKSEKLQKSQYSDLLFAVHEWTVTNPQLWWPNGLGDQPLYHLHVYVRDKFGNQHDQYQCRIGLRTVTVSTDKNEYGNEFAITVNHIRIFTMGANYIPEDNILSRIHAKRSYRLVENCAKANFNCLRVWGGGFYPDDYFYDACDEMGILVWQDLMFGCNVYALNSTFEENIIAETRDNVRRLRHHASLALWCGNNEMEWGWGDEWARIKGHHPRYKADYTKIFEYILPKVVYACDDSTFYWPSSPSSGGSFDDPNATNRGDQHYWEVWHSGKPFTAYGDFSFCSEYGFQSFPHSKTIASFTLPEDRNIFSRVMESHQKNGAANGKILNYVADYFLYPKNTDSLAYISQILQLKAIEYGVLHWRRNRGRCMGSLYWQLNDCWPVASWASIDYYGRYKALHYGAAKFYAPVTISICEKEELSSELAYFVHNDTRETVNVTIKMLLMDCDYQSLWEKEMDVSVEPLSVMKCMTMDFSDWLLTDSKRSSVYAVFRMYRENSFVMERTVLFVKPKHFMYKKPYYTIEIKEEESDFKILIKASSFCQYTELYFMDYDPIFSDNFFDITSLEGVTVCAHKSWFPNGISTEELKQNLVVRSVADSYSMDEKG